jgi:hypothetical protein
VLDAIEFVCSSFAQSVARLRDIAKQNTKRTIIMPKFVVTKVTVRREASTTQYLSNGAHKDDLKELLKGVADMKSWVFKESNGKITAAWPEVPGHPGHVDGSDWKMYVERGKQTVDRLMITGRKYTVVPNKSKPDQMNVEISCNAFVETDTH